MIYIGNNEISNIYIGTDKIYGIYVGDLQIYPTDFGIVTAISLENLVWVTDVPHSGGTADSGNCSFSVIAYYDNGKSENVTHDATISGSLVVPEATADTREMVGILTLTATYSGFTATGSVDVYQEAAVPDFSTKPLTFNILSAGTINWTASNTANTKTIEYKLNNGAWVSITSNTGSSAPTITVNSGDKIQFRGNNAQYGAFLKYNFLYNSFTGSTASFEAEGNIMSLIYGDNFKNELTISSTYALAGLFEDCVKLVSAENLVLPATTLANYCYQYMFYGCTSLATAPAILPANTLANTCYGNMFSDCTSLTQAPALPATTLAFGCYQNMFYGCTSLTIAPELPATTLASSCYGSMFSNCTSLTTAPVLHATTLASSCYSSMFGGCTSLTVAPELPATTLVGGCYNGMFYGCTSLTTAPELPATTLAIACYQSMFQGCTSLTTAPELPATTLADSCYHEMFYGTNVLPDCNNIDFASSTVVASGGLRGLFAGTKVTDNDLERLLPKNDNGKYYLPATTLAEGCYQEMFQGCTSLTTAPELPAETLADSCYMYMFSNCTSLTTAPALPVTTLADSCYAGMFYGCTSLTTAPELPSETLVDNCYAEMFADCSSLNYIKCLAIDISAYGCTDYWVSGVADTGTFVKNQNTISTSWERGDSGIPTGWTVVNNS